MSGVPIPYRDATIQSQTPILSVRSVKLPANGRGDDLQLRVSAPLTGGALPIILFSHGFGSSMDGYAPLAHYWAAHGFVVIQPTFLDAKRLALTPDDPRRATIWRQRIADVMQVLDGLDAILAVVPGLADRVDPVRIAAAGHSFGAWTTSMLLGARTLIDGVEGEDWFDPRIKAGVLLSAGGLGGDSLTPFAKEHTPYLDTDFAHLATPTLAIVGDDDHSPLTTRGPDWYRDPYRHAPGVRTLLTLIGGGHMLGGISGYDVTETDDENPLRVGLIQKASTAFLRSELYADDTVWARFKVSLAHQKTLGNVEEK